MKTPSRVLGTIAACAMLFGALLTSLPASAASPQSDLERFDAMQTVPMSDEFAGELRGEGLTSWAVTAAVKFVAKALGKNVSARLDAFLQRNEPPTYSEYRQHFGPLASAILSAIPWWAKPHVVQ